MGTGVGIMKGGAFNIPRLTKAGAQWDQYDLWRHDCHTITVIHDKDDGRWFSVIRILRDPDDWFGKERRLPDAISAMLRAYIYEGAV